jgi:Mitochondrial import protein Pam17
LKVSRRKSVVSFAISVVNDKKCYLVKTSSVRLVPYLFQSGPRTSAPHKKNPGIVEKQLLMAMLRPASRVIIASPLCTTPSSLIRAAFQQSSAVVSASSCRTPAFFNYQPLHFRPFTSTAPPNADRLSWDEFLRLRRQRRLSGVIASIPSSMLGIYAGVQYFGSGEIDPTQTILGFDPILMNAAFVLGCGVLGWLVGPTLGRGIWHALHRKQTQLIGQVRIPPFLRFGDRF